MHTVECNRFPGDSMCTGAGSPAESDSLPPHALASLAFAQGFFRRVAPLCLLAGSYVLVA
eukprot:357473-Chlamydomonas_euryale.AAC.7